MIQISLVFRFKEHHHYQLTECKNRVFNTKTNREIKITEKKRSLGAYVSGKFIPLSKFNENIEPINQGSNSNECDGLLSKLNNIDISKIPTTFLM